VISGAGSNTVIKRLNGLGITDIHLAVKDKVAVLENYLQQHHFNLTQVAYIGDDIPDLACMKMVGVAVCPADAVQQIKAIAHYVSPLKGGEGCVRDFIEKVMTIRNDWNNEFSNTTTSA
jgi:3-deoxy-D-manno-octulosonate 8-phosphate phosphatase (KDO 8-P phosphatase)